MEKTHQIHHLRQYQDFFSKTCGIGQSPMFCKTCGIGQSPCGIGQSPMFCKFFMFYNELYSKISLIISECYSHPVQKVGLEES